MCGEIFDGVDGVFVGLYVVSVLLKELLVGCFEFVAGEPVVEVVPFGIIVTDGVIFVGKELVCFLVGDVFFGCVNSGQAFESDMIGIGAGHDSPIEVE